MAEFIVPANQKIIWDTLQKHPYCSIVFPSGSDQAKINWFKNIISETYYSIQGKTIIRTQLLQINKNILKRMIDELKEIVERKSSQNQTNNQKSNILQEKYSIENINFQPINPIQTETSYSRESILENKNSEFQNSLEQRQREYGDLFKKPTPPVIEFEQAADSVIQNMDELIQQQLRERENDINQIKNNIKPLTIETPVKNPIEINDIIELDESINNIPDIKKHVSWDLTNQEVLIQEKKNENHQNKLELQNKLEITELNRKYARLIDFLEIKIENFKIDFSQYEKEQEIL